MTANAIGETATIYQFPERGRAGLRRGRYEAQDTKVDAERTSCVTCGGVSYHEDAIREDARLRRN